MNVRSFECGKGPRGRRGEESGRSIEGREKTRTTISTLATY
jgi:hypothetical protein